jgi:RAB protein geranylgeranyltransferase component A
LTGLSIEDQATAAVDASKSRSQSIRHVEFQYWPSTADSVTTDGDQVESKNSVQIDMTRVNSQDDSAFNTITKLLSEHFDSPSKNTNLAIDFEVDRLIHSLPPTSSVSVDVSDSINRITALKEALDTSRHYNFDLAPKLLACRGEMVEVLIKSGIGRYLEFKGVEQSYVFDWESQAFDKVN